jgi:hypothetical protein
MTMFGERVHRSTGWSSLLSEICNKDEIRD